MNRILLLFLASALAIPFASGQKNTSLKVATYNLRMDTSADSLNAWSYRKDRVNALIAYHDFDIVGTQEGFAHQLRDICDLPGYAYFGAGRDDGNSAGEHSAIFYKTERFELVEGGNFWLRENPDEPGKGWDATCCNRICSWVKLKDRHSGKDFFVFNVHFDHEGVIARRESGKLMAARIAAIAKDMPAICTGDFNSTDDTEQIKLMSEAMSDSRRIALMPPYGPEGTFNHRFANPLHSRIDYIFVSRHFYVGKYAAITDNDGRYYPSDHLPVAVDLSLRP